MVKRHSTEIKVEALKLLARGHGPSTVARHLGLKRSTVAGWKREALKEGALDLGEIGSEKMELSEDVDSKIRQLLGRLEREMMSVKIKDAKDLKDLSSAVGQLVTARKTLDLLSTGGKKTMNNSKHNSRDLYEGLNARQLKVVLAILGDEKMAKEIEEDFRLEELDKIIALVSISDHPDTAGAVGIFRNARSQLEARLAAKKKAEESQAEDQESEE